MDFVRRHPRVAALVLPLAGFIAMNIGGSLFGDTPDTRDTTEQIADYFTEHRNAMMAGTTISTGAMVVLLATAVRVGTLLARAGTPVAGRFVQIAGAVVATMVTVTMFLPNATLAYVVAADEPHVARAMFLGTLVASNFIAWPLAAMLLTTGAAWWSGRLPGRWFAVLTIVVGLLVVLGVGAFAFSGFFSPDVQQQVVFMAMMVWLLTVGFALPAQRGASAFSAGPVPPSGTLVTENPLE